MMLANSLARKLCTCHSQTYALIEIGTALNRLQSETSLSEQQRGAFLDEVKADLMEINRGDQWSDTMLSCIDRFRLVSHITSSRS